LTPNGFVELTDLLAALLALPIGPVHRLDVLDTRWQPRLLPVAEREVVRPRCRFVMNARSLLSSQIRLLVSCHFGVYTTQCSAPAGVRAAT
jgi:hypothetical protein